MRTGSASCAVASVAMALAMAGVSCGGAAPTSTAPTQVPSVASVLGPTAVLAIRSDAKPALVALGVPVVFDASESVGADLSYVIAFGDGESTTKVTEAHVPRSAGARTAKLTVTDRQGRSSSVDVPYFVASLDSAQSMVWQSTPGADGIAALLLAQDGDRLSGTYYEAGAAPMKRAVTGAVTAASKLSLATTDHVVALDGALEWKSGSAANCLAQSCVALRLSMQGGVNSGRSAEFAPAAIGPAPTAGLTIASDQTQAFGWRGYTPFEFDASASAGTALTYRIEFGDSQSTIKPRDTHVSNEWAFVTARLTVTDILGRTSDTTQLYAVFPLEGFADHWNLVRANPLSEPGRNLYIGPTSSRFVDHSWPEPREFLMNGALEGHRVNIQTSDASLGFSGRFEWIGCWPAMGSRPGPWCLELRLAARGGTLDGRQVVFRHWMQ